MKNKKLVALLMIFVGAVSVGGITACNNTTKPVEENPPAVQVQVTVTFETNGGTEVPAQGALTGELISEPGAPTRYGYDLVGWYKDSACTQKWNFASDTVTGNMTLYALWAVKDATADSYFRFTELKDGTYSIGAAVGETLPVDVVLPSVHEEKPVTTIVQSAFNGQEAIRSVYIPDTYKAIESMAFRNCASLQYVQEAENVETVGANAFYGTAWEEAQKGSVYVGKCYYKYIGEMAADTELTVDDGTVSIADSALAGQSNLVKVNLPESLKYIGAGSFGGNLEANGTGLTEVVIPDGVESIGDNAFRNSKSLATVTLGDKVKSIGNYAFANTIISTFTYNTEAELGTNIFYGVTVEGKLVVGDNITELPMGLITGWEGLVALELGAGITELPYQAFATLPNLKEVVADNVTSIGQEAFSGTAIESFTISEKVSKIGMYAFKDCASLKTVTINSDQIAGLGSGFTLFTGCTNLETVTIGDNVTAIPDYLFASFDNAATTLVFGANVTSIGQYAFYKASINTGVVGEFVIPDTVTELGNYAFGYSTYTKLTVGENVKSAMYQFTNMTSLKTLVWNAINCTNSGVTSVSGGVGLFQYLNKVTSPIETLIIGDKVESLPEKFMAYPDHYQSLYNNTTLKEITIPASLKTIPDLAFYRCAALETVNGIENVANISRTAFVGTAYYASHFIGGEDGYLYMHNNKTLVGFYGEGGFAAGTTLKIPEGIEIIANEAFYNSSFLKMEGYTNVVGLELPSTLKEIGSRAFSNFSGLTGTISIPAGVEKIGDYAFNYCSKAKFDFSLCKDTVKYIGNYAFYQVGSSAAELEEMEIQFSALEYLGYYAFGSTRIKSIDLTGSTLTEIPQYAFGSLKYAPTTVTLPASVETVGNSWCTLTSCETLTAPGLKKVGNDGLYGLQDTTFDLTQIKYFGDGALRGLNRESITLAPDYCGINLFGSYTVTSTATTITGSTALKEVTIQGDWTIVKAGMFVGCTALEKVTFENGVTSVGSYAFHSCANITSFDFSKVTDIGDYAFCSSGLTSVEFGDDLSLMGVYAFSACKSLTGEVALGQKLKSVPDSAFRESSGINKVTVGGTITAISGAAFRDCTSLKEIIIGEGVTSVEGIQSVGAGCKVTLPSTVINIGMCSAAIIEFTSFIEPELKKNSDGTISTTYFAPSVLICKDADYEKFTASSTWSSLSAKFIKPSGILNDSVSGLWYIDPNGKALYYTGSKTSIVLPKEVKTFSLSTVIGTANFVNVTSFTLGEGVTEYVQTDGVVYNKDKTQIVYYPAYLTDTTYTAPATVTSVGSYAFYKNTVLTSVNLPEVTTIGSYSFNGCVNLKTVSGDKLTTIESMAFYGASSAQMTLSSINLSNVTEIGSNAFYYCTALNNIDLSKVTTIGAGAFRYCTALTSVDLSSLTEISGTYAFGNCTSLQTVVIGENLTAFKNFTFTGCTALQSITIKATTPPTGTTNMFGTASAFAKYNDNQGAKIYVPAASLEAYKAATGWSAYASYIEAIPEATT